MSMLQFGMPLIAAGVFFLASMMMVFGTYQVFAQRARKQQAVDKIRGRNVSAASSTGESGKKTSRLATWAINLSKKTGKDKEFLQTAYDSPARLQFFQAGFRGRNTPAIFWMVQSILFLGLPASVAMMWVLKVVPMKTVYMGLAIGIAGFIGYSFPRFWLDSRIKKRRTKIKKALPDVLDLLVVCVEAGTGLYAALNTVAVELQSAHPEMSDELRFMDLEIRAGKLREKALQDLAARIGLDEMTSLTSLLTQSDRFGTDLAKSLRTYSHVFRKQRFQEVEKLAAVLPVKMMIPLILFIMPSLFVVILGPAIIKIKDALFTMM